jgi:hypothetical protein
VQVLVGFDPEKLQHVDATTHIFFEIAATVGQLHTRRWPASPELC